MVISRTPKAAPHGSVLLFRLLNLLYTPTILDKNKPLDLPTAPPHSWCLPISLRYWAASAEAGE